MAKPPPSDTHAFTPNDVNQFACCAYQVLKMVHPPLELSIGAQVLLGNLSACMLTRVAEIGLELRNKTGSTADDEVTPANVINAFLAKSGELARHAESESTRAINKRATFLTEPRRHSRLGATAGLLFRVQVLIDAAARHSDERLDLFQDERFAIGLGAAAEYLLAEVLELSGHRAGNMIRAEHLSTAIREDEALYGVMPDMGLMPGVTPEEAVDRFFDPFSPALMEAFTIGSGTAARFTRSETREPWAAPLGETPAAVHTTMSRVGVDGVVVVGWRVSHFGSTPLLAADWVAPPIGQTSDGDEAPDSERGLFGLAYPCQYYEQRLVHADIEMRGKDGQSALTFRVELGYDAVLSRFEPGVRDSVFATVFDANAGGVVVAGGYSREGAGPRIVLAPTAPAALDKDKLEQACAALGQACFDVWS
eukprot:m.112718 g.112718  ORF g.112718 m.112718 type:complete len:423 (+) comp16195_c0_seq2:100-1368(+)